MINSYITDEQTSKRLARVRRQNTSPELQVRKALHSKGYRYKIHSKSLPGTPDLVFPKKRKVIFIHGCYWHRHSCKKGKSIPQRNKELWLRKFKNVLARDKRVIKELAKLDWEVLVLWECHINKNLLDVCSQVSDFLDTPTT